MLGLVAGPTPAQVRKHSDDALTSNGRQIPAHGEVMSRVTARKEMWEGQGRLAPTGCNGAEEGAKRRLGRGGT